VRFPSLSPAKQYTALIVVALVATIAFIRAPWNGYAMDDPAILANPLLRAADTLPDTLVSAWWWQGGYLYRPLTLFTFAVDQLAGNGAPWLPHTINVVLHALVAVGVTRLYGRFLPTGAALMAGVLFAVLPAHVEAVSSVVGRAELLSALAMVALMLVVTQEQPPTRRARLLAALLSAAALASKEGGVAAPVLALVAAWGWPTQRRHALQWAAAALAGTAAMLLARVLVLGTLGGDLVNLAFRDLSAGRRLIVAFTMLPRAATMLLLPLTPVIDYAPSWAELQQPNPLLAALGVLLVVVALAAFVVHPRRPSAITLGLCITAATLAPTSNLFFASGVVLAPRTLYAPSIGAGLVVGAALAWLWTTRARVVLPYAVAALAAWGFLVTWREVPVWRSSRTALIAMGEHQPDSYKVPVYWAHVALREGRNADALAQYRIAVARFPADHEMLTDGALVALRTHDTTQAIAWLHEALTVSPRSTRARSQLTAILRARGDSAPPVAPGRRSD
jgi:hypothetical protein